VTVDLRSTRGFDAAMAVVRTDAGKRTMDQLRRQTVVMEQHWEVQFDDLWARREVANIWRGFIAGALCMVTLLCFLWAYGKIESASQAIEQAMNAAEQQKQLLEVTLASIGDGVIVTDMQGASRSSTAKRSG